MTNYQQDFLFDEPLEYPALSGLNIFSIPEYPHAPSSAVRHISRLDCCARNSRQRFSERITKLVKYMVSRQNGKKKNTPTYP